MEKEVKIEEGREKDNLTLMMHEVFEKVNKYNDENPGNEIDIMVLACDKKGGASFLIGDPDKIVHELLEMTTRHPGFRQFIRSI